MKRLSEATAAAQASPECSRGSTGHGARCWRSCPTLAEAAPACPAGVASQRGPSLSRPWPRVPREASRCLLQTPRQCGAPMLPDRRGEAGLGFQRDAESCFYECVAGCALSGLGVPAACQGGSERPCSGNGHCSGDGSRQGDGSCQCHPGYRGPLCADCMDSYFNSLRNETHSICSGTRSCLCRWEGDPVTADPGFWELRGKAWALVRRKKGHDRTSSRGWSHFLSPNKPQEGRVSCLPVMSFWRRAQRVGSVAPPAL